MKKNKSIKSDFTGLIRRKFEWVTQVPLHEIRIGETITGKDCRGFSSIVAKVNRDNRDATGIHYLGHYSRDKKYVSVYATTVEEYEEYKDFPALRSAWQESIPEKYK